VAAPLLNLGFDRLVTYPGASVRRIKKFRAFYYFFILQKIHKNKYTVSFQHNAVAYPHICYFSL
jgi:hypothetical protein